MAKENRKYIATRRGDSVRIIRFREDKYEDAQWDEENDDVIIVWAKSTSGAKAIAEAKFSELEPIVA